MCPAFKGKSFSTISIHKTPVWRLHLFRKLNDMNVRDPLAARHHLFLGLEVCSWAKRSGYANGKPIRSAALLRKKTVSEAWVSFSSSATASDDHLSISHQWMMTVILCNHGRLGVGDEWTVILSLTGTSAFEVFGSCVCTRQSRQRIVTMVTNDQKIQVSASLPDVHAEVWP